MELFFEVLLAAVCAVGLAGAGWWLVGRLLRPIPGARIRVVIYGEGDGASLEQSVRSLMFLRSLGLLSCPVRIRSRDLNPEGKELARKLARRWPAVDVDL